MGILKDVQRASLDALSVLKDGSVLKRTIEPKKSKISPKEHQEVVRDFMNRDDTRGLIVFHGLGTGKTFTSIFAADSFIKENRKSRVIVILSASVKAQFIEQVSRVSKYASRFDFFSRQEFVRLPSKYTKRCKDSMIIVDEAHNVRNIDGKITKAIIKCTDVAAKVLLLTATPLVNAIHEIGSMVRLLSTRSRIPLKHNSFVMEFGEDGLKNERRMKRLLKDKISFHVSEGGSSGFPKEIFHEVFVPMEPRQCEIYDGVMRGKFSSKLENVISDPTAMAKALVFFQKPRQFCNIVREGSAVYQPKIDALASRVIKSVSKGKKCVVYSQYIDSGLEPIADKFKKERMRFDTINGDTPKEDKSRMIKEYNSGKLSVLLLSRTASEGLDLKETSEIHILEPHFHMSSLQQVKGRGIRYKSHKDPEAVVKVFVYFAKKCNSTSNTKPSPKTQSMDVILWFLNKKKQDIIDTFTDRVLIPSSIENARFSFIEARKKLSTRVIEHPLDPESEESDDSGKGNNDISDSEEEIKKSNESGTDESEESDTERDDDTDSDRDDDTDTSDADSDSDHDNVPRVKTSSKRTSSGKKSSRKGSGLDLDNNGDEMWVV